MTHSIHARLTLAAGLLLAAFLSATAFALERAFRDSAEAALRERLQGHVYALLAASDLAADGTLGLPAALPDPRFSTPGSGLYGQVEGLDKGTQWTSPSQLGLTVAYRSEGLAHGLRRYETLSASDGTPLMALSFAVLWEDERKRFHHFIYHVAEDLAPLETQLAGFRRTLWGWLGALGLLLLGAQLLVLRWGLTPLRRVAADLAAIEAGRQHALTGAYPRELQPLTANLNALLQHERAHLERYRNTLGDLAHSLKTPLAVLRGVAERGDDDTGMAPAVREQVERMNQIVDYQLQRAATAGRTPLAAPLDAAALLRKVAETLRKVHAERGIRIEIEAAEAVSFRGEEGDFLELAGNLMDNACKWCRKSVRASLERVSKPNRGGAGGTLRLRVEDDGPGIEPALAEEILERGVRADTRVPGHGIGLAIVRDIVAVYGGELSLARSALGGLSAEVRLPI